MSVSRQRKLSFERLEARDCPTVYANVFFGNLNITAVNSTSLAILQLDADSYQITENGTNVITRDGVTGSLNIKNIGWNGANVSIDFNGMGTVKNVSNAFLTTGVNSLSIVNGTITGKLFVFGGIKADNVTLGDGEVGLDVNGYATVNLFSGGGDSLTVNSNVTFGSSLSTSLIENVTLASGSTVTGSAFFLAGLKGNTYNLEGAVNGSVWYTGGLGSDSFTASATSTIGDDLTMFLLGGNDTVNLEGSIADNLKIVSSGFGGTKTINLGGTVGNNAVIYLGWGNDVVNFTGSVANTLTVHTGFGNDTVTFDDASTVTTANVNLGPGDDIFNLGAAATVSGGTINGFIGNDTFNGTASASFANLTVINFDTLNP